MDTESKSNKSGKRPEEPVWQECIELLDRLPALPREERITAIQRLVRNSSPGIRSRALRMGAALLSDDTLTQYLRNDADDVLRNAGLEMLKMRGGRGFTLAVNLLRDPDPDVSLQAVLVLDHLKDPRALEPLRAQLRHSDPNVQQGVIVSIGHMGDARSIPDLLPFLEADPWLQLAAVEALGDLRAPAAVAPLSELLTDLMVGPLAAEALARIGGTRAFHCLANHWLRFEEELEPETSLGLLAHVLEGLRRPPAVTEAFRSALDRHLEEGNASSRWAAARCLVALGPGAEDESALELLADRYKDALLLPACLAHRVDLLPVLLSADDHRRAWGFLLAAQHPKQVPVAELTRSLAGPLESGWLELVVAALKKLRGPAVAAALLDLFVRLPIPERAVLAPLLPDHKKHLTELLVDGKDLPTETELVVRARLGEAPRRILERIGTLPLSSRLKVLAQLSDQAALMRGLPWQEWLDRDPSTYGPVAVEATVEVGLRELAPTLRRLLASEPTVELIRAMGELGDRESVPTLVKLLGTVDAGHRAVILESLGRIGGPEVRATLRRVAKGTDPDQSRIAFKALSLCATEEDDQFFREAVGHGDWYVRLSCAEVLGRFQRPDNLAALAQLASDPSTIVAQRALAYLEPEAGGR
ncbi:MAG: HEAT repeat domain-containing protein [Acidobacteria bacterium]|nr:HEAT repeat domain-containing protein [Acidobacteriota bacterium]